jgi:thiosulfate reductase cytochrome b subunit
MVTIAAQARSAEQTPVARDAHLGHARWVRASHALLAASVLTLAFSGFVVLMSHPRLYWGKVGNDLTPALFELPISRNFHHGGWVNRFAFYAGTSSQVSASRTYDIFNDNGWGRSLHFLAAWFLVITGAVYVLAGIVSRHVRRNLIPRRAELAPRLLWRDLSTHVRFQIEPTSGGPPYGLLQRCAYVVVVFAVLPLMVVTGLAMSPAATAALPFIADVFGGSQSARTLHFFLFVLLMLFLVVHLLMVALSGLRQQLRAMTVGK